jgi:hypothetical protein
MTRTSSETKVEQQYSKLIKKINKVLNSLSLYQFEFMDDKRKDKYIQDMVDIIKNVINDKELSEFIVK